MPFNLLMESPLGFVVWVIAILTALTVHEFSHALASTVLGDSTARNSGRLTLNPLAHIDLLGFLALIFVGFGWGKPVPFNPYNLSVKRWGPALVGLAGPAANLFFAGISVLVLKTLRLTTDLSVSNLLIQFLFLFLTINLILLLFNLIPVPPLDGSKLLFAVLSSPKYAPMMLSMETRGPLILLAIILLDSFFGLGIFSLLFRGFVNFVYGLI
ncbi:site-2 protease family protein [Candidatus Uhrbacteria bacterium]|nr:site-2 protease family protein [Candidatus Uhrbacteria bacterium]